MEMNVGLEMEMEMGMGMQKLVCERSGSCNDAEDGGGRETVQSSSVFWPHSDHIIYVLGPTWFAGAELCIRQIYPLAENHAAHSLRNAQRDLERLCWQPSQSHSVFPISHSSVTFADWQTLFQPELDMSKIKMEPVLDLPLSLHSAGRLI